MRNVLRVACCVMVMGMLVAAAGQAQALMTNDPAIKIKITTPSPEPDIDHYIVEQATSPDGPWTYLGVILIFDPELALDYLLLEDGKYWHRVMAVDRHGNKSNPSPLTEHEQEVADLDRIPPSQPAPPTVMGRILSALMRLFRGWKA